jgi:hypothetical protein
MYVWQRHKKTITAAARSAIEDGSGTVRITDEKIVHHKAVAQRKEGSQMDMPGAGGIAV